MDHEDAMDFRTIKTSVRPARVAVLVKKNDAQWMHTCLRLIEWCTAVWGGWYTCFVPTDGETIDERFWHVLERFDPDYICQYVKTNKDTYLSNPEYYREIVDQKVEQAIVQFGSSEKDNLRQTIEHGLMDSGFYHWEVSGALQDEIKRRTNPFYTGTDISVTPIVARPRSVGFPLTGTEVVTANLSAPLHAVAYNMHPDRTPSIQLQLMSYDLTGKIWSDHSETLQKSNVKLRAEVNSTSDIDWLLSKCWKSETVLWDSSLAACGTYRSPGEHPTGLPTVLVIGDALEDYCLYHALERMRGKTMWIPKSLILHCQNYISIDGSADGYQPGEEGSYSQLLSLLQQRAMSVPIHVASVSVPKAELHPIAVSISEQALVNVELVDDIEDMLTTVRRIYNCDNVDKKYRDMFNEGLSVNFINTPLPKDLKRVPPNDLFWITEVGIENYQLPTRPEFGPATLKAHLYNSNDVRVTRDGYAYFCPYHSSFDGDVDSILARPQIQVLQTKQIFGKVFGAAGYNIEYSDKGNYHLGCMRKFGSLEQFAEFTRNSEYRQILAEYVRKPRGGAGDALVDAAIKCTIKDRSYFQFEYFVKIIGEGTDLGPLIQPLLDKGVMRRGFVFKCQECRQVDWYSVEDVSETFRCARCRMTQAYTKKHWKNGNEPAWYYKLDEVVFQWIDNNGDVPVLTLAKMQVQSTRSFLYLPECEVANDADPGQKMELDFCCCVDGVIYIGEAKKSDKLADDAKSEQRALEKYRLLSDQICAKFVVLSTFADEWSIRTIENANKILGEGRVRLFTKSLLLNSR